MEQVILVDTDDNEIGQMEKMEAHRKAVLHRAFSVFLFNSKNELLLQQRAFSKYHSGGLWTNTCCSHPQPSEPLAQATSRRLREEMGMDCAMTPLLSFIYKAELKDGLTEHELDHVFIGHTDEIPHINTDEVESWKYVSLDDIEDEIATSPDQYTAWFKIIFERVKNHMKTIS